MTVHPREGYGRAIGDGGYSRREFLRLAAAAAAGGALAAALPTGWAQASVSTSGLPLPRPDHPVAWPTFTKPIRSGQSPERGATLRLYNWVAYINEKVVQNFGKKYGCKVEVTTFNTMEEAIGKLRSGQLDFDVFVPTVDVLGPLIESKLLQPLNHSYIPNITQAWPEFQNPFYDQRWQYTVPYTIYTSGMAWRKDHVNENPYKMSNAWAMPWQSKYRGKVAILDDYRESIALGLMKNGHFDLNTTDTNLLQLATGSLLELSKLVNVHIDNNDYSNVPSGQIWIHHAWSGDIAAAPGYLPKGTPVEVVGYWFPTDGRGPVGNDTMVVLSSAKNPVLAHLFLNYLLDLPNVLENISYNGYMQPLNEVTPQRLVKEGILPPSLTSTAVLPSYFRRGVSELALPPAVDAEWQQDWLRISCGV